MFIHFKTLFPTKNLKKFIQNYQEVSKISSTALNELYQVLTGDNSNISSKLEEKRQERFAEILASHEERDLVHDMRYFNGNEGSNVFYKIWDEVKLFNEYTASVHERQGSILCLRLAISIQ